MAKPGRIPLPDPNNPITWAKQMELEKVDETTFKSLAGTPYASFVMRNGEERPRAYGMFLLLIRVCLGFGKRECGIGG
jgi:hypothetical protein